MRVRFWQCFNTVRRLQHGIPVRHQELSPAPMVNFCQEVPSAFGI
jgi:hypothetical protein